MNFESSLLPVLGGYWLVTHLIPTRTDALRRSGYHTAFQSAFWGLMLLVAAYPVALGLGGRWPALLPGTFDRAALLSVVLGVLAPVLLNRFFDQEKAERRIVNQSGDLIELLIAESIERGKLIEVSLRSGKSYIGFALVTRVASWPESQVSMFPMSSGYRDKDTRELKITTHYAPVVLGYLEDRQVPIESFSEMLRDFRVVIPRSEIVSVRLFDPNLHRRFRAIVEPEDAERG